MAGHREQGATESRTADSRALTIISAVSTLDLVSTPRSFPWRGAVVLAGVVALSCTAAKTSPQALRRAIESLAGDDQPCRHASLAARDAVRWQDVISTFDLMRSLGHDSIALKGADIEASVGGCETVP